MKKYLAILITVILIASLCATCACDNGEELTLYVPDGAPALSVAKIINDGKVGNCTVTTNVVDAKNVRAKCVSGEADMAVLPTNLAVTVCSQRSDYQIFSVNVYGVLYIVGREHVDSIAELQGKTLYSIGWQNTPEYVFKHICDKLNVNYVDENSTDVDGKINIIYKDDAKQIIPMIKQGLVDFALIGEPAVTQLKNNVSGVETLFDLQQLWQEVTDSHEVGYPQASLIVKKDLLTDGFATQLLLALQANYQFATTHLSQLNAIMQGAGSDLDLNYTVDLLERCNLRAIPASSAINDLNIYLEKFADLANLLPLSSDIIYEAKH